MQQISTKYEKTHLALLSVRRTHSLVAPRATENPYAGPGDIFSRGYINPVQDGCKGQAFIEPIALAAEVSFSHK